jgi:hypothetical protein
VSLIQTAKSIILNTLSQKEIINQALTTSRSIQLVLNGRNLYITVVKISIVIYLNLVVQLEVKPLQLAAWTENCDFTFESLLDIQALYQNSVFSRSIQKRLKKIQCFPVLQRPWCIVCKIEFVQLYIYKKS